MKDNTYFKIGVVLIIICVVLFGTAGGIKLINEWQFSLRKADDATNYETLKKVENTCRSMITSYESDKLTYEQYMGSSDKDELNRAKSAKMRANKTAAEYNNYILKNSFVWKDGVPNDITGELDYLE